jgi:thiol-disulfide isomerase/thioredoxin
MRVIILFLVVSIITGKLFAQKNTVICGNVNSAQSFIVSIYSPINGYHNLAFVDTTNRNSALVNGKDSIYKTIKLDAPSFVCIRFENENKDFIHRTDLLLFPGDSVNLHFNLAFDGPDWAAYRGSNAAGQKLFNEINYQPYPKFIPVFDALNRLPGNKHTFVKEIDNCVAENVNKFKALGQTAPISAEFIKTMDVCFKMLFYQQVINKFINKFKQREVINKDERDTILNNLTSRLPGTDPRLFGLYNSPLYLDIYFNYLTYKKYKLNSIAGLYIKDTVYSQNGHQYNIDKNLAPMVYIEDKMMQQDLWALNLLTYLRLAVGAYDDSTINQFCDIFPGNKWEKLLRQQLLNNSGTLNINYQLQSPIKFIDSTKNIKQFDVLLKELPTGKPVFVDCWASWCGPCIGAFSFNKPLDSLLLANKIERLYVSIDNPAAKEKWKSSINKYCLGGYHILANKDLINDIKRICNIPNPEQSPIEIPRYLLINKKGTVVINDAISPHDFDLLKNQIIKNIL